jgi:hypothetical protein
MVVAAANPIIVKPKLEFGKLRLFLYGFDSIFHRADINTVYNFIIRHFYVSFLNYRSEMLVK